jgi:hypothetical protein
MDLAVHSNQSEKKNTDGTVRCDGRGRETSAADGTCELVRTSGRQWPCFGRSWLYENKKKIRASFHFALDRGDSTRVLFACGDHDPYYHT